MLEPCVASRILRRIRVCELFVLRHASRKGFLIIAQISTAGVSHRTSCVVCESLSCIGHAERGLGFAHAPETPYINVGGHDIGTRSERVCASTLNGGGQGEWILTRKS